MPQTHPAPDWPGQAPPIARHDPAPWQLRLPHSGFKVLLGHPSISSHRDPRCLSVPTRQFRKQAYWKGGVACPWTQTLGLKTGGQIQNPRVAPINPAASSIQSVPGSGYSSQTDLSVLLPCLAHAPCSRHLEHARLQAHAPLSHLCLSSALSQDYGPPGQPRHGPALRTPWSEQHIRCQCECRVHTYWLGGLEQAM